MKITKTYHLTNICITQGNRSIEYRDGLNDYYVVYRNGLTETIVTIDMDRYWKAKKKYHSNKELGFILPTIKTEDFNQLKGVKK